MITTQSLRKRGMGERKEKPARIGQAFSHFTFYSSLKP
jgi:hypothetical protein